MPNFLIAAILRVRGIECLRACDASAMLVQITSTLYETVKMITEKAADIILGCSPLSPDHL
ncbi:MAG: hypothetical protein O3A15_01130 [Proteobacteria bacterium]|nr:hypothetical protein [Pseudomonadota bacterium]